MWKRTQQALVVSQQSEHSKLGLERWGERFKVGKLPPHLRLAKDLIWYRIRNGKRTHELKHRQCPVRG
jgi:hypothetical protein